MHDKFWDIEQINFLEACAGYGAIYREVEKFFNDIEKPVNIHCIEIEGIFQNSLRR